MEWNLAGNMLFLGLGAYGDLKKRSVSLILPGVFAVGAFLWQIIGNSMSYGEWFMGIVPGILLLLIGKVSREAIGYGDGIVVLVCGLLLGISGIVGLAVTAFFLSFLCSAYLMVFRRADRRQELPFIPFLLVAQVIILVFGG